ncbi:MAG: FprA family A-type flavoprotein [bacterium]
MSGFRAVRVSEHAWWVGAVDWPIADFHGYATDRGTTYNAYLITGDKPTLVDTVKAPFMEEMMARIASVMDPSLIKYVVSNHAERDHTGCFVDTVARLKPEKVFASQMGVKNLHAQFHDACDITAVKDGEKLSLGNLNLTFLETRMLHWPDSMVSYLHEDAVLFSQDAFGMHLATGKLFADENDPAVLEWEARKYYANILLLYSGLVAKAVERIKGLGIPINVLAPDHGPVWRKDVLTPVGWYANWAAQKPGNKAVVVYDTMWQSTELLARSIADGIAEGGSEVRVLSMHTAHRSDVMTELLGAGALVAGSPTINNDLFPTVADVLTYARGLKPKNLIGAAFASYGWSGESAGLVEEYLKQMGVELVAPALKVRFKPTEEELQKCRELGRLISSKLVERAGAA